MPDSSRSSRSRAGGNGSPNPRCSRSHQPAPTPTNARPPERTSRVAAALAVTPGGRKVTGVTRVPSRSRVSRPASRPSVTQGSGIGSQAVPTCGTWIRWSISAIPAKPASSAASATSRSHVAGSSPQGNRETWRTTSRPSRAAGRAAASPREPGSRRRRPPRGPGPSPRPRAPGRRERKVRTCWVSTFAGTGRSRRALRRRHSSGRPCRTRRPRRAAGAPGPGRATRSVVRRPGRGCPRRW